MEGDHDRKQAQKDSYKVAAASLAVGLAEIATGTVSPSWSLFADTAHSIGDGSGYGINAATANKDTETHLKWRKRAARLVCLGALAVTLRSAQEVVVDEGEKPDLAVPIVVGVSTAVSLGAHHRMRKYEHLGEGHADNARHARWDAACGLIAVPATLLAYSGVPKIDSVGGVIIGAITIMANRPSQVE